MNVSYNKITKLIIPQKTSENMDNLQIDLFSNTLPVDWNEKNVGIQVIIGQFSTLKISLTSRYVHHFSCDDESVFWTRKAWGEPLFYVFKRETESEGVWLL